ncbi:short chain oxidoreductase [Stachybotrys elegans]|uniref:Short chain oxidoreductase n=1 Tax=Stachybotrys elegans TaxID=80388 RepID=A0A8K0SHH0_9HYPO|nr:short chain oxidoreductase [Stachybotrys elegans]
MASYFISGASRGIGLGFCEALAKRPASDVAIVFAGARTITDALKELASSSNGRVEIVPMDVTKADDIKTAALQVEKSLHGKGLDVLFNNAGVCNFMSQGIQHMDDLDSTLHVNVTSAHLVTRGLLPLLQKGNLKKVINITSTFGSIGMARKFMQAPTPAYKISKAALNMLTVQYALSFEEEGFTFVAVTPGWVKTDLGGQYADLDVDISVKAVMEVVDRVTAADNGKFLDVHVPGWENNPGLNQYAGGEPEW